MKDKLEKFKIARRIVKGKGWTTEDVMKLGELVYREECIQLGICEHDNPLPSPECGCGT